jgi:predicted O-methyltransferase YrrM
MILMLTIDELVQKARGFQESRILLTALELDLFTAVGRGGSAVEIARKLGTDPRATEMLLNALAAIGALLKTGDQFRNTPETARHLAAGSPEYAQPGLLHTVHLWDSWSTLTEAVRKGSAVTEPGLETRDAGWREAFIAAMHRNAATHARRMVQIVPAKSSRRMLDIGGGSGAYSIAFAQAVPELTAEVFDLEAVVPIAGRHIREAGLEQRVRTRTGDLRRDEFGAGYDLLLLSAICHMLSPEENADLLRRCYQAAAPGGMLVIRDFILEEDRTAPKDAALFAINMLVATRGGSSYTEGEYFDWLKQAGYTTVERLAADVIAGKRA